MLIQFALTLTVLLGFCGLALDVGYTELLKMKLQNAADAAALGAAYAVPTLSDETTAGRADAALNGYTHNGSTVTVNISVPTTGPYANNTQAAQAVVTAQLNPIFLPGARSISAQATAVANPTSCAYLLSQSLTDKPSLNANNVSLSAPDTPGCGVYLGYSYFFNGSSSSSGYQYYVSGSGGADSGTVSPAAITGLSTLTDPLSSVPAPATQSCLKTGLYTVPASVTVLQPGLYCGGLTIATGTKVTLSPGIYQIAGPLMITRSSGGSLTTVVQGSSPTSSDTGSGVMFYLTQQSGYPYGTALIKDSAVTLTAATTGSWQGILFFADRTLPTPGAQTDSQSNSLALLQIRNYSVGNTTATLDGILYLPHQGFHSSYSNLMGTQYFGIVADWYTVNNTGLYLSGGGSSPLPQGGASLVQ